MGQYSMNNLQTPMNCLPGEPLKDAPSADMPVPELPDVPPLDGFAESLDDPAQAWELERQLDA
jgi:hypothetical protein